MKKFFKVGIFLILVLYVVIILINKKFLKEIKQFNIYGQAPLTEVNMTLTDGGEIADYSKELYVLPSVADIEIAGTQRGNRHDRQHLGIYMPNQSSFEIRQTNTTLNQDLTMEVLNNDSQTEKSVTIPKDGDWVTVVADADSVPFIKTLFDVNQIPEVEVRNCSGVKELTYYPYEGDEDSFFAKWNQNNHSYAVLENEFTTFLVPIKDRDIIV